MLFRSQAVSLGGLALGLTLLLAALLTGQDPEGQSLRPARLVMALLLLGAAAMGAVLQRRGHARTAIGLQLVVLFKAGAAIPPKLVDFDVRVLGCLVPTGDGEFGKPPEPESDEEPGGDGDEKPPAKLEKPERKG